MSPQDLDRFLASVQSPALEDYLDIQHGETAEEALDRRLRWAARVRNQPDQAPEAMFLLQHQDELRDQLQQTSPDYEDEWIEFGDAHDDEFSGVRMYGSGGGSTDMVDLSEPVAPPEPPPSPPVSPRGPPPRPASISRTPDPIPDGTPTPHAQLRGVSPAPPRPRTPRPGSARSAGPLLDRARATPPPPAVGRLSGRARTPGSTPSPPPVSRYSNPGARPRSPTPSRMPTATPHSHANTQMHTPRPAPSYGAPQGTPQPRSATPAPPRFPTPTPGGAGFDVRIRGADRFVRSNDQYGTSEVVYESELDSRALGAAPVQTITPSHGGTHREPQAEPDILGSLRGGVRKGGSGSIVGGVAKRDSNIPVWIWLSLVLVLVVFIGIGTYGFQAGWYNSMLGLDQQIVSEDAGSAFSDRVRRIPDEQDDGVNDGSDAGTATDEDGDGSADVGDEGADGTADADVPTTGTPASTASDTPPPSPAASGTRQPAATSGKPAGTSSSDKPAATTTSDKPAATTASDKPAATTASDKPAATTTSDKPAATTTSDKPAATTTSDEPAASGTAEDGTGDAAASDKPADVPAPRPPVSGNWTGRVGNVGCTATFTQTGDDVVGKITLAGSIYKVTGRYNSSRQSVYLKGDNDSDVVFRGNVTNGRIHDATAKLGAGQPTMPWSMIR